MDPRLAALALAVMLFLAVSLAKGEPARATETVSGPDYYMESERLPVLDSTSYIPTPVPGEEYIRGLSPTAQIAYRSWRRQLDRTALLGVYSIRITDGNRTAEEQYDLYQKGRTLPGDIVTYADGFTKLSNHQGGYAWDFVVTFNGKALWYGDDAEADRIYDTNAGLVTSIGLRSGYHFRSLFDPYHIEVPK